MLIGQQLHIFMRANHPQRWPEPQPKRPRDIHQNRRSGCLIQRKMKAVVRLQIVRHRPRLNGAVNIGVNRLQPGDQPLGHRGHRQFGQMRLYRQPRKRQLIYQRRRQMRHRYAPVALRQQRAFCGQPPDRLTHRGHPRIQIADQALNGDGLPRLQMAE